MATFTVEWTIEIEAATPEEAARQALAIQRDADSTSTCFDVYADDPDEGDGYHHHRVDFEANRQEAAYLDANARLTKALDDAENQPIECGPVELDFSAEAAL